MTQQQQQANNSSRQQPLIVQNHQQRSSQRNRKSTDQDPLVGQRRRMNSSSSSSNQTMVQEGSVAILYGQPGTMGNGFQNSHHHLHHQFSGPQIDLTEECGGLFVEYQTNRSSLGGLEELNSLNVTNCDSETLEEHMNMLSGEDCFGVHDDYQEYGLNSSSDNFLNMLFTGPPNSGQHQANPIQEQQQQQQVPTDQVSNGQSIFELAGQVGSATTTMTIDKLDSSEKNNATATTTKQTQSQTNRKGRGTNNNSNMTTTKQNETGSGAKQTTTAAAKRPTNSKRKASDKSQQATGCAPSRPQLKIATTNTNRRLMPKRPPGASRQGQAASNSAASSSSSPSSSSSSTATAPKRKSSSWMASPSSLSNASSCSVAHSPSSSSQFDYETPYRQQLENLRKKLKMDVPPQASLASEKVVTSHQAASGPSGGVPVTVLATNQATDASTTTTYVIARPLNAPGNVFEAPNGAAGTIYLRTSASLLPINSTLGSQAAANTDGNLTILTGFSGDADQFPSTQNQMDCQTLAPVSIASDNNDQSAKQQARVMTINCVNFNGQEQYQAEPAADLIFEAANASSKKCSYKLV